jgi:autotransporter-associated beta strand protein
MQGLDNAFVLDGGAIIDTAGYDITIAQALMAGGSGTGGLTKQGSGILYLNGASGYTGPTMVSVGGLAGVGSLASPVSVASGASLLAGPSLTNTGTLTINNTVTLQAGSSAVMKITKISGSTGSDNLSGISTLNYGGTLVVKTNVDMNDVFAAGDAFTLFSATTYHGAFSSFNLPALPAGLGWDTSALTNGIIQIVSVPTAPPVFNSVLLQNGNLILSGSGGTALGSYRVYATTNLTLPLANWTPIATNSFDSSGNFIFTNAVDPAKPALFFNLSNP